MLARRAYVAMEGSPHPGARATPRRAPLQLAFGKLALSGKRLPILAFEVRPATGRNFCSLHLLKLGPPESTFAKTAVIPVASGTVSNARMSSLMTSISNLAGKVAPGGGGRGQPSRSDTTLKNESVSSGLGNEAEVQRVYFQMQQERARSWSGEPKQDVSSCRCTLISMARRG